MKNFKNALIGGLVTLIAFYVVCTCLTPLYSFVFVGDNYTISYHIYTYVGVTLLGSIVVFCTIMIIGKINELEEKITKENKDKEDSKH